MDRDTFDYFNLRGQIGDVLRDQSAAAQSQSPWRIINMLPNTLVLWTEQYQSGDPKFFTEIKSRETLVYSPDQFSDRDQLYVYYRYQGKLVPFMEPYMFRNIWKTIRVGAVTYSSEGGHGQVQASNWDLRGVWLNNCLPIPLDVYYRGRLAAQIGGYNGLSYMGGGASSLYFDNDREGLNFMDQITFKYSLPGDAGKYLFDVVIDDEQCLSMNIGVVSGGLWGPNPDNAVYRVDRPSYTGITYYLPIGRGNSVATNPYAPF